MNVLLIVYDNGAHVNRFPLGLGYLAAVASKEHNITIYNQDIHHYSESHLTQYIDERDFDFIGLSFIGGYYQYRKALKISEAVNRVKKRPFYAVGGHGPSPEPEFFLRKTGADAVCIGEGEVTFLELLEALKNKTPLKNVSGIVFKDGGGVTVNPKRELIFDIDTIPFPAYDLFPIEHYRLFLHPNMERTEFSMPMLSGRGCPFSCNFCYRMDKGFRPRSNESIIEEIKFLNRDYGITYIAFFDELLMTSEGRVESFCHDLIKSKLKIKMLANGRLNYAKPDLLRLMRQAGFVFLNYGIECLDDDVLNRMHKKLTVKQITEGIEATLGAGISPGFNIIFGNYGENRETLRKGVAFLKKYDDGAQVRTIRPVTPYPGSELYYDAIKMGKLKGCEDFYENKHVNSDLLSVNFTDISDDDFYSALYEANDELLTIASERQRKQQKEILKRLYLEKDSTFRGFRTV